MGFKYVARGYTLLLIIAYGVFFLKSLGNPAIWFEITTWVNWAANFIGILAVILFAYCKPVLSKTFWRMVFLFMLGVYGMQLWQTGLLGPGSASAVNITILLNYLFLVAPFFFVTAYFSFSKRNR